MANSINFRNKRIYYESTGKGNTIVFLHGFLESSSMWKDFSEKLSGQFQVICIDLPGFGKTDIFGETHTMEFMAESVKIVLEELKIKNCIMVGHSMGGYTSLAFLEQYPELLKGIVLFHSHASADTKEAMINRDRTIKIVEKDRKNFISQFIADLFASKSKERFDDHIRQHIKLARLTKREGIIAALRGMKERSSKLKLLSETQIPVKFILGKEDKRIPLQKVLAQTILPEHSEVLILSDTGHMGFIEAKKRTLNSIRCFAENSFEEIN